MRKDISTCALPAVRDDSVANPTYIPTRVSLSCLSLVRAKQASLSFLSVLSSHNNNSHGHVPLVDVEKESGGGAWVRESRMVEAVLRRRASKHACIASRARVRVVSPSSDRRGCRSTCTSHAPCDLTFHWLRPSSSRRAPGPTMDERMRSSCKAGAKRCARAAVVADVRANGGALVPESTFFSFLCIHLDPFLLLPSCFHGSTLLSCSILPLLAHIEVEFSLLALFIPHCYPCLSFVLLHCLFRDTCRIFSTISIVTEVSIATHLRGKGEK